MYSILFDCAASTLKDFGLNPNKLNAEIGMTGVLHTHSRCLDYHPHCYFVVPGGGFNPLRKQWKKVKGKYLFNEFALAKVFRARCLDALNKAGLSIQYPCKINLTKKNVHCIWRLPEDDDDFSKRWRLIKTHFSKNMGLNERISKSRKRKKERGIWQRRFWEHLIKDEKDDQNHLDYIHYNPVKQGYVQQVIDWP